MSSLIYIEVSDESYVPLHACSAMFSMGEGKNKTWHIQFETSIVNIDATMARAILSSVQVITRKKGVKS